MPCDLCRKLSFCVYFMLTSAFRISGPLAYTHARRSLGYYRKTYSLSRFVAAKEEGTVEHDVQQPHFKACNPPDLVV